MQKTIYQFWEGIIPANVKDDMEDLRQKAVAAGYDVQVYDLQRIIDELEDKNLIEALRRMKKYLPISMFASACSDFFRYWVLQNGGIYMDTDVICTTDDFPTLPTDDGVYFCSEQTRITNLNTCVSIVNGDMGKLYARIMTQISVDKLKATWLDSFEKCRANAQYLIDNKWSLIGYLGPALVRYYVPHLMMQGIKMQRLPYDLCSSHKPTSALWHAGDGTWVAGGKGNDNAQRKNQ